VTASGRKTSFPTARPAKNADQILRSARAQRGEGEGVSELTDESTALKDLSSKHAVELGLSLVGRWRVSEEVEEDGHELGVELSEAHN
jgi:hypothetical protein